MRPDLFVHALNLIDSGRAAEEASKELNAVIKGVQDTNKPGELQLTIKVLPHGDGRYQLLHDIKKKLPPKQKYSTMVWATPDGNLQKSDPNQGDIFVQDATPKPTTVVDTTAVKR